MISLCNDWEFSETWSEDFMRFQGAARPVRLPHTVKECSLHYAGPRDYEMVSGYRRKLDIPAEYRGKCLFLQFDGAAHIATVYCNGVKCAQHRCGYTAFRVEISDLVRYGAENELAVRLDSTENPTVPPFGFVIDYLTYGGLYREVWLDVRERSYIADLYTVTPSYDRLEAKLSIEGDYAWTRLSILDGDQILASELGRDSFTVRVPRAESWSPEQPKLYTCRAELLDGQGRLLDRVENRVGFRTIEFKADGFYLNGKKSFLRGLNRHQCYPYIGYAAPAHLQFEDARILKEELACNAVRTSHYPQSQHFIDACDELGLLVFTEIPGWQHIGDKAWQDQAVENVREMILQYRNHPSIVLWGVRINESQDNNIFYRRTNDLAHALDPSRPTSGVRFIQKSSLLEDVYAYNDFSHTGLNPGCRPKSEVTPDMVNAYHEKKEREGQRLDESSLKISGDTLIFDGPVDVGEFFKFCREYANKRDGVIYVRYRCHNTSNVNFNYDGSLIFQHDFWPENWRNVTIHGSVVSMEGSIRINSNSGSQQSTINGALVTLGTTSSDSGIWLDHQTNVNDGAVISAGDIYCSDSFNITSDSAWIDIVDPPQTVTKEYVGLTQ